MNSNPLSTTPDSTTSLLPVARSPIALSAASLMAIFAMVCAAYLPAISGGYVWDDDAITDNPQVRTAPGIVGIWTAPAANLKEKHYWPMVYTSYWLEDRLFGLNPVINHLINVILHAANAILIALLLAQMGVGCAWLAAAIFALHPAHVESVAWVIERKDGLSTLLYLLSFLAYRHSREKDNPSAYAASLICFVLAMLTKSIVISLPVALALATIWEKGRLSMKDLRSLAPFAVIGIAMAAGDLAYVRRLENGEDYGIAMVERVMIAGRAMVFYLGKSLWPNSLMSIYPRWNVESMSAIQSVFGVGILIALTVMATRHKFRSTLLLPLIYFVVTLVPILGLITFGFIRLSFVADRYQYLASIGLNIIMAAAIHAIVLRIGRSIPELKIAAIAVLLLVLGALTWRQAAIYKGPLELWSHNVARNPTSWTAFSNLAFAQADSNLLDEAHENYLRALAIKPEYENAKLGLAHLLIRNGKLDEGIAQYREVIGFMPQSKGAYNDLGRALELKGDFAGAEENYRKALTLDPASIETLVNYGSMLAEQGKPDEAMKLFASGRDLAPYHSDLNAAIGIFLEAQGKPDEALAHYQTALETNPRNVAARGNLAAMLAQMGRLPEAESHLREAVRIQSDFYEGRMNLAMILQRSGRMDEALEQLTLLIKFHPEHPDANFQYGLGLARAGRMEEARAAFDKAAKLAPDRAEFKEALNRAGGPLP